VTKYRGTQPDRGSILPLVLVITVVLASVTVAIASYATSGLKYAGVVEDRADRLAAADGALRYGIEKLRLNQSLCTTNAGSGSGYTTEFPPTINGATSTVTCRRVGSGAGDVQGWAVVVTGGTTGTGVLSTQGGIAKTFGGPTYVHDKTHLDLQGGDLTVESGDIWYTDTCSSSVFPATSGLRFEPAFLRGPICTDRSFGEMFRAPVVDVPTTAAPPPGTVGTCKVFYPGKYTSAPVLAADNYFTAGNYYFENVDFQISHARVVAGFTDGRHGDNQSFSQSADCQLAQSADISSGALPGATFYLGGTSRIWVETQGELEVLRRDQGGVSVSLQALDADGTGYLASTLGLSSPVHNSTPIVGAKPGSSQDLAMHGLVWAPRAFAKFDNVANRARGQVLGGIVIGSIEAQSSNGDGLLIRVESNPVDSNLLLEATATKSGSTTTIRAVVEIQPDTDYLAVNSWRVVD
jgi:Tfp pilus assembly protein PilX